MSFSDYTAQKKVIEVSGLTKQEKCSWVIRTTQDAPSFKIATPEADMLPTGTNGYDLHYIEYDNNVRRESSTDHIQFDNQSIDNKVYGTFYDKDRYDE